MGNIEKTTLLSKWSGKTFLSLGDSITALDGKKYSDLPGIITGYQTILKEKLGFFSQDNRGVSGQPMADGSRNGVGTVTTGLTLIYDLYDLVIIAAGTNDFKLNMPLGILGSVGDKGFDRKTFYGAYRTLIEYMLTKKPELRICLFTPLQRDHSGYDVNFQNSAGHKLIDYVNAVKSIGQMYSIPVCDFYSNSGITKLNLHWFTYDGLHPNNEGYARIGDYASRFISMI